MTIHNEMFDDKKTKESTMHRIYVEFEDENGEPYFITSLDPHFNKHIQEMVEDMGRPTKVEFRASDEGWIKD